MIRAIQRSGRRLLGGLTEPRTFPRYGSHEHMFYSAFWLVRFYYLANLFFVYSQLSGVRNLGLSNAETYLLWPVVWIESVGLELGSLIILHVSMLAGVLALLFWHNRLVRIVVVISQLMVAALANSFGGITHGFHEWLWIGFCFIFLPSGKINEIRALRVQRMSFLLVFSMAQGLILLFYSLSGFYKVLAASKALLAGQVGGFAPQAMALTMASRMTQTNTDAIWAPFIIENYWIGWPLYLGLYYIELVAIFVFLRPNLHRIWGLALIAFHLGTFLFMEITFAAHVMINAMLFVFSPFASSQIDWRATIRQLPIFGWLAIPFTSARNRGVTTAEV